MKKLYQAWVQQAKLPPLTNNQAKFAEWLLDNEDKVAMIGDMESIFKSVRKYLRQ